MGEVGGIAPMEPTNPPIDAFSAVNSASVVVAYATCLDLQTVGRW